MKTRYISVRKLREITNWSRPTVYKYLKENKIEGIKDLSGKWLVDYHSIPSYLREEQNDNN